MFKTKTMSKVIQMGFDIKVGPEITQDELKNLFNEIEYVINNYYDINGCAQKIESIGAFNSENITELYKNVDEIN